MERTIAPARDRLARIIRAGRAATAGDGARARMAAALRREDREAQDVARTWLATDREHGGGGLSELDARRVTRGPGRPRAPGGDHGESIMAGDSALAAGASARQGGWQIAANRLASMASSDSTTDIASAAEAIDAARACRRETPVLVLHRRLAAADDAAKAWRAIERAVQIGLLLVDNATRRIARSDKGRMFFSRLAQRGADAASSRRGRRRMARSSGLTVSLDRDAT